MGYASLRQCVADLERTGQLIRIECEIDPYLEAAEVHRRVCRAGGPALFFTRVKGCQFPMVSNLFGTLARAEFLFRDTLAAVRHLVELKIDPAAFWKRPWRYRDVPRAAWHVRPKWVRRAPILDLQTTLSRLPQLQCWPMDGGPFVTLPVVYTEDASRPGWRHSNLGMYRVQLSGNEYMPDRQAGLHYQIHRGIGVHHAKAIEKGVPFRVNVFVGGPPQEDTSFGRLIHELTGPVIPSVVPGVHAVHAVDAAGVHPLLLAIGSERYVPYAAARKPQELLTCANAILGQGQLSLAKYLLIVAREDDPSLNVHDIRAFFRHLLERFDPRTDLHFQTCTTIDTLDYSGTGLNEGSKVVI